MNPATVPLQSQNAAACGQTPATQAKSGVAPGPLTGPVATTGSGPAVMGAAAARPIGATAPGAACVLGSGSAPEVQNNTGKYIAMAIGGLIGLITIAAIVQKYKTMGSYSSFWGRMIGLGLGAVAFGMGYKDYSAHSANDCSNFMGEAEFSSPCPCLACCYVLFGFGLFQLGFNLPFLYASEKSISNMYAKFGLFVQASVMLTISGGCAGVVKFANGSIMSMIICAGGCVVAVLFLLGWFKGEDGVLSRMFQSAKDMINNAGEAAAALVDDGLKVFGLDADERSKVTLQNVYNFCRVHRGPNWSAGDEDGGPDGPGGEIIGYIGENGVAEGVAITASQPGWAKVKWDPKVPGQVGKTAEYRIGANNKFELKMAEETERIVDKLMGQTFAMFGYDPSGSKPGIKEKRQIEFILTSRLPGEDEDENQADLKDDDADEDEGNAKSQSKKSIEQLQKAAAAAKSEILIMSCEVFNADGESQGRCDDMKQMLFKSAIRHRELGNKQDAIVVELQKLPAEAVLLSLTVKVPEGKKLGAWGSMNVRATSTGHDLSKLTLSQQEGSQGIQKHQGSEGFLCMMLYSPEAGKWYAEKAPASLGPVAGIPEAVAAKVRKFLTDRIPKKKKKKKGEAAADPNAKDVEGLVSVDEVFENIKIEDKCEEQAREMMKAKLTAVTNAYVARLKAQGIPEAKAALQAKKLALIQINKQHQLMFQRTLIIRRAFYLKQRMHPVHAMIMAKKDANRAALYDGREAEVRQAVMNTIIEEKRAQEVAKKAEEEQAANTYAGQATALVGNLWSSWGGEEEPKKKKKKKKDGEEEADISPAAAPAPAAALPPQFAHMTPQQIAAIRAMQQRQLAAKAAAAAGAAPK